MSDFIRYNNLYYSLTQDNKLVHVGLLLKRAHDKYPNNCALICDDQKIDYKNLYYQSNFFAQELLKYNINQDKDQEIDRIIIIYQNSIEFYIAYFAIWTVGAIVVPINIFSTEQEIINIIDNANPKVLIIAEQFLEKFPKLNNLNIPIISQIKIEDYDQKHEENYKKINIKERNIKDVAVILYTSGTTGNPKGVMLTSENIIINSIQGLSRFENSQNDRVYCPLPLFHSLPQNTIIWSTTIIGATAITTSKIDRHKIINNLSHNPTVIVAVPPIYGLFAKMKNLNLDSVRFFVSGGDVLSNKIRKYFELIYRRKLCNGYGLTETSPFISVDLDEYNQPTNTIGSPFWGISYQIRDENLNALDINQVGTLWVNGPNIMKGYYKNEAQTKEVIKNCWFNTGDLAYINQDGKIVIAGREKDLIKSKGIKIYPQEIENLLLTNDKVLQAAVIGKKNTSENKNLESQEEYPIAFIATTEKDIDKLKNELINLTRENLATYKIPREIIIKRELPLSPTGKIDKKTLRNLLNQES